MSGSGTWSTGFWGQNQWNDLADPTFTVSGIALTASLGDETTVGEINLGWGRANWGDFAWGVAGNVVPTGLPITGTLASVVASIDVSPGPSTNNNQLITTALGSVTVDIATTIFQTGFALTNSLGIADAGPDAMATGNAMSMGLGTIDAFNQTGWGRQGWNVNAWGVEGQFANVDVTGIAMTAAVSAPEAVKGDANLTLNTLNVAQATLGNVDPAPDAMIIGEPMIANLGTALGLAGAGASPTGIPMTAALGTAVGVPGQEVDVTGISMNNQLASVSVEIHVDIQLTGLSLTINQGSGSALIWNEVNTGSAPLDPPGWQEVAA